MMEAAYIKGYGVDRLEVGQLPVPSDPLPSGSVLVRVAAVALNPADFKMRSGELKVMRGKPGPSNPVVLGADVVGTVEKLGPGLSGAWQVGDTVMGVSLTGALATLTVLFEDNMVLKPEQVPPEQACGLVTVGLTACQMLRKVHEAVELERPGVTRLLITGGAGGVGQVAIQMAKRMSQIATVVTTARPGPKTDLVRSLGADEVVDHTSPGLQEALRALGPFDAAIDCVGQAKMCSKLVRKGGVVVSCLALPSGSMLKQVVAAYRQDPLPGAVFACLNCITACGNGCRKTPIHGIISIPRAADLSQVATAAARGLIRVAIDSTYPLAEAPSAFDKLQEGHCSGKVIVIV